MLYLVRNTTQARHQTPSHRLPISIMSSYLSSLTTHYSSLRRLLPTSLSEDADLHVNSEQDSHVSRVLRAYYTEKGRPFPAWLGPDPNAASRAPIPALATTSSSSSTGSASLRSGRGAAGQTSGGGGGLGDLFADSPSQGTNNSAESLSLRSRRPNLRSPGFKSGSSDAIPYPQRVAQAPTSQKPYASRNATAPPPNVRPLPSQREGSYQARPGTGVTPSTSSFQSTSSAGSSVQERLKARLGGGSRGTSPVFNNSSTPPPPSSSSSGAKEYDPYSSSNYNLNGGGSFNPYEDSGSSGSRRNPYASASDEGRQPYASSSINKPGNSKAPYVGAASPWVEDGYGGGGASSDYTGGSSSFLSGRRGPGLPSSPRRNR